MYLQWVVICAKIWKDWSLKRFVRWSCQISGCCCPTAALEIGQRRLPSPQYYLLLLLLLPAFLTNPYKSSLFPAPAATDRLQYPHKSAISCLPTHYAGLSCLLNVKPTLYCVNLTNPWHSTKSCNMKQPSSCFPVLWMSSLHQQKLPVTVLHHLSVCSNRLLCKRFDANWKIGPKKLVFKSKLSKTERLHYEITL